MRPPGGRQFKNSTARLMIGIAMTSELAQELVAAVDQIARQLKRIDPAVAQHRPASDRWSIQEVVGHLIDSAANNHQRFVRAQQSEELTFPKYDQVRWVSDQHYNMAPWYDLVDLWCSYNIHLAHVIRNIPDDALSVSCTIGDNEPVTLLLLIEDYLVHMQHHLKKIAERVSELSSNTNR